MTHMIATGVPATNICLRAVENIEERVVSVEERLVASNDAASAVVAEMTTKFETMRGTFQSMIDSNTSAGGTHIETVIQPMLNNFMTTMQDSMNAMSVTVRNSLEEMRYVFTRVHPCCLLRGCTRRHSTGTPQFFPRQA